MPHSPDILTETFVVKLNSNYSYMISHSSRYLKNILTHLVNVLMHMRCLLFAPVLLSWLEFSCEL